MLVALFKQLHWRHCAIVSSTQNLFLLSSDAWSQQLAADTISVEPLITFGAREFRPASLTKIKKSRVRIVIALAYSDDIVQIALDAALSGMTAAGWAWVGADTIMGAEGAVDLVSRSRACSALSGWVYLMPAYPQDLQGTFFPQVKSYGEKFFNLSISSVAPQAANLYNTVRYTYPYICSYRYARMHRRAKCL